MNDENALDKLYDAYMENDSANLLNEEFDVMIEELREQGQVKAKEQTKEIAATSDKEKLNNGIMGREKTERVCKRCH